MNLTDIKAIKKNDDLVLYQDTLCSVVQIDETVNRVLIKDAEKPTFGEFASRYVEPSQLSMVNQDT